MAGDDNKSLTFVGVRLREASRDIAMELAPIQGQSSSVVSGDENLRKGSPPEQMITPQTFFPFQEGNKHVIPHEARIFEEGELPEVSEDTEMNQAPTPGQSFTVVGRDEDLREQVSQNLQSNPQTSYLSATAEQDNHQEGVCVEQFFGRPDIQRLLDDSAVRRGNEMPRSVTDFAKNNGNSASISKLNEYCQKKHLQRPSFEYSPNGNGFGVTLTLQYGQVSENGPFASQKDAKQMISVVGLAFLQKNLPAKDDKTRMTSHTLSTSYIGQENIPEDVTQTVHPDDRERAPLTTRKAALALHPDVKGNVPLKMTKLYERCSSRGIKAKCVFPKIWASGHGIALTLDGETLTDRGPFDSKQDAMEQIAQKGLERLGGSDLSMSKEHRDGLVGSIRTGDWAEVLERYFKYCGYFPTPAFIRLRTGPDTWGAQCKMPQLTSEFFYSGRSFHSYSEAKIDAAHQALNWLRSQNMIRPTVIDLFMEVEGTKVKKSKGGHKRTKSKMMDGAINTQPFAATMDIDHGKASKAPRLHVQERFPRSPFDELDLKRSGPSTKQEAPEKRVDLWVEKAEEASLDLEQPSFEVRVHVLAQSLNLPPPSYQIAPQHASSRSIYTGAAYFPRVPGEPKPWTGGPVGEVRAVFGARNAKERCAEKVLEFLKGVSQERSEGGKGKMQVDQAEGGETMLGEVPRPRIKVEMVE
ncbi:MAG: hypothetical protein M1833_005617 [Piccolia ochrophora]|nr:MAG: hypothetical protein M1833_005617 [Piccolia ochrophora]